MAWRARQSYATGVFDFYPLYYGAKAWLLNGNAYNLRPVVPAADQASSLFRIGNAYPLPAVLLALPFSFLSPTIAGMLWIGLLTAGLLLALRLADLSPWWAFSLPVLDGIRLEQYTILVVVMQIVAVWAWRTRRPWVLALCCALILTKPNQGLFFVAIIVLLARNWRHMLVVQAIFWGGALLLDPNWIGEWLPTLEQYRSVSQWPILWGLALAAIPLLLLRDWLGAAIALQFLILPYPTSSAYAATAVPLTVLDQRRSHWLNAFSYSWLIFLPLFGGAWAVALSVILPTVAAAILRHVGWPLRRSPAVVPSITAGADQSDPNSDPILA
jgi:hypothetical protein